ncbi:MAG TPA: AIR synthase related protein, partial [Kofleriaceae bacterium]
MDSKIFFASALTTRGLPRISSIPDDETTTGTAPKGTGLWGDIGRLAVNGTVNDLAMSGARPLYLSAGFIL